MFWIDRRMWEMAAYLRWSHIEVQLSALVWACLGVYITSGAPNENIVQNHLNIAWLNVFYYLKGRYRHIFIP